jgi:hypothetical protein
MLMFTKFLANEAGGETAGESRTFDWLSDDIKCALIGTGWTPNQDSDEFFSDISAHEMSGTGYTAGGQLLAGKTLTVNTGSNEVVFDANDPTWASSTLTNVRYCVFYKDTGTPASSFLICYHDFGSNKSSEGNNFIVELSASGLFKKTTA